MKGTGQINAIEYNRREKQKAAEKDVKKKILMVKVEGEKKKNSVNIAQSVVRPVGHLQSVRLIAAWCGYCILWRLLPFCRLFFLLILLSSFHPSGCILLTAQVKRTGSGKRIWPLCMMS